MSATVDRLVEMESLTAPLPWPLEQFYEMPGDMFQLLYGLTQAWPLIREEVARLESSVLELSAENAQLHAEHRRVVSGATALGSQLADLTERHERTTAENAEAMDVLTRQRDVLQRTVQQLPARFAAAEAVCESFTTTKTGSGGAHGFIDGAALDAWKGAH
jgi:hypothetical protein